MRRTTICRSKASVTFALLALGAVAPLRAQQTPAPAPQPAAQQPATPAAPLPAVHVVQPGETLWSLAQQYFGDPLLWPEIYRLNTDVVEDPWWIFPGEELRLSGPATEAAAEQPAPTTPTVVAVTPEADTTRPPVAQTPARPEAQTIFATINRRQSVTGAALEVDASQSYRAVREGEYYSANFLSGTERLPTGRLLGNVQSSNVRRLSTSTSAQRFSEVGIQPPDDSLREGDLLLSVRRGDLIRGFGDIIIPTGLLRVTGTASPQRAAALVVALYGAVTDGQEVMRVARYRAATAVRPEEVSDGVTGEVVALAKPGDVVHMQDQVFINKGADDGVRLGDTFRILGNDRTREEFAGQLLPQAEAVIINVRSRTATALIVSLRRPDVRPGSTARQIRRMPS